MQLRSAVVEDVRFRVLEDGTVYKIMSGKEFLANFWRSISASPWMTFLATKQAHKDAPAGAGDTDRGRSRPEIGGPAPRTLYHILLLTATSNEEFFLKIHIKLPGNGEITIEREPMDWDRFFAICVLIGIYMVGSGFLKLFLG